MSGDYPWTKKKKKTKSKEKHQNREDTAWAECNPHLFYGLAFVSFAGQQTLNLFDFPDRN